MEVATEFCGLAGNTRGEEVDEPGEEADMPGEEEDMGLLLSAFPGERAAASAGPGEEEHTCNHQQYKVLMPIQGYSLWLYKVLMPIQGYSLWLYKGTHSGYSWVHPICFSSSPYPFPQPA